jgi:tetratricopeptide (TPR) repeat protein
MPPFTEPQADLYERKELRQFISLFNQYFPRGMHTSHPDCSNWEGLRVKFIAEIELESVERLKLIKSEILSYVQPLLIASTCDKLRHITGVSVIGVRDIARSSESRDHITSKSVYLTWCGLPVVARLDELMAVESFLIDGVTVSLKQPLTSRAQADMFGSIYDLVGKLRAQFPEVREVKANPGVALDFNLAGERYLLTVFGALKFNNQVLHPTDSNRRIDPSTHISVRNLFVADELENRSGVEWDFRHAHNAETYLKVTWIEGFGIYTEEFLGGVITHRSTLNSQGALVTSRDTQTGLIRVFDTQSGLPIMEILAYPIGSGLKGARTDKKLASQQIAEVYASGDAVSPPTRVVLFGQDGRSLVLSQSSNQVAHSVNLENWKALYDLEDPDQFKKAWQYLVTHGFIYVSDSDTAEKPADYWQSAAETLNRRDIFGRVQGDCEDVSFLAEESAKQSGHNAAVICFATHKSAHAICVLFDRCRDGGYTATSICNFGVDQNGALNADKARPGSSPNLYEAISRILAKYPHPKGLKTIPLPIISGIPCVTVIYIGEDNSHQRVTMPLAALVDRALKEEVIQKGGLDLILENQSPVADEHPWIASIRGLLNSSKEQKTELKYILDLVRFDFADEVLNKAAQQIDFNGASDGQRQELIEALMAQAKNPYQSIERFKIFLDLLKRVGADKEIALVLQTRINASERLIREQNLHPNRLDLALETSYIETLYLAMLHGLTTEVSEQPQVSQELFVSSLSKLKLLVPRIVILDRIAEWNEAGSFKLNIYLADEYKQMLDDLRAEPVYYLPLANCYVAQKSYEPALGLFKAAIDARASLGLEDVRAIKYMLDDLPNIEGTADLTELSDNLTQSLRSNADRLQQARYSEIGGLTYFSDILSLLDAGYVLEDRRYVESALKLIKQDIKLNEETAVPNQGIGLNKSEQAFQKRLFDLGFKSEALEVWTLCVEARERYQSQRDNPAWERIHRLIRRTNVAPFNYPLNR